MSSKQELLGLRKVDLIARILNNEKEIDTLRSQIRETDTLLTVERKAKGRVENQLMSAARTIEMWERIFSLLERVVPHAAAPRDSAKEV